MQKLRPDYYIVGVREAALDSVTAQLPACNFTGDFEKARKISLSLATFAILMFSFNISSPFTISTGIASISVGDLKLFFILILIYQLYLLKCFTDEFKLSASNITEPLKQTYYHYLLCRRAAMLFREKELHCNSDKTFEMSGVELNEGTHHAPAMRHQFDSQEEADYWERKLDPDFRIHHYTTISWSHIYLVDSQVTEDDLKYWHNNKSRIYLRRKPVTNYYYLPLAYIAVGIAATIGMLLPDMRNKFHELIMEVHITDVAGAILSAVSS